MLLLKMAQFLLNVMGVASECGLGVPKTELKKVSAYGVCLVT